MESETRGKKVRQHVSHNWVIKCFTFALSVDVEDFSFHRS